MNDKGMCKLHGEFTLTEGCVQCLAERHEGTASGMIIMAEPTKEQTRVLHLTLKKQWFDEIASSRKRDEFRLVTPYWKKRLEGRVFDEIHFKNGFSKDAPFMRVKCRWVRKGQTYYVISLGEILEVSNDVRTQMQGMS